MGAKGALIKALSIVAGVSGPLHDPASEGAGDGLRGFEEAIFCKRLGERREERQEPEGASADKASTDEAGVFEVATA